MSPGSSASDERPPAAFLRGAGGERPASLASSEESHSQGRAHFQAQLQELEANALGGLDLIVEQLEWFAPNRVQRLRGDLSYVYRHARISARAARISRRR